MDKNLGDYIVRAGSFMLDVTRDTINQHEEEIVLAVQEEGLATTIAILYEAKIPDEQIIRLIQKYYKVCDYDIREKLRIERTIEFPCRELQFFLMQEEGLSSDEARNYIINHRIGDMLKETPGLWKLSPRELLKRIEK